MGLSMEWVWCEIKQTVFRSMHLLIDHLKHLFELMPPLCLGWNEHRVSTRQHVVAKGCTTLSTHANFACERLVRTNFTYTILLRISLCEHCKTSRNLVFPLSLVQHQHICMVYQNLFINNGPIYVQCENFVLMNIVHIRYHIYNHRLVF